MSARTNVDKTVSVTQQCISSRVMQMCKKKKKNHTLVLTHERSWGHNLLLNFDWSTLKYIQILRRCKTCVQLHFLHSLLAVFFFATWARLLYVTLAQNANTELHLLLPLGASLCYRLEEVRRWSLWPVCCLCCVMVHFLDSTKVDSLCLIETDVSSG